MKKPNPIFSLGIVFLLMFYSVQDYAQMKISLKYPSYFQFIPTDLWNVTIINLNTDSKTVYLVGSVKDNSQNVLVKVTSASFTVAPGYHTFSSSGITTSSIDYFNSDIQQALSSTGQFPAASYVSCVAVYDNSNAAQLDENCVENTVEVINPPHLVFPTDDAQIDNAYPVFSWSAAYPLRAGQDVSYQVKIVQLDENQSAADGISRNEAYYQNSFDNTFLLSYGFDNLPFEENTYYAWQVTAYIGDFLIGKSEVWKFSYKPADVDSATYGLDDSYFLLKLKTDGGYYLANGCVKFRFTDEYRTGVKNVKLLTTANKDITPNNLDLKRPFNDDRYVIDLKNIQDIEDQKYYMMQVNTNSGQNYLIRFKYTEPIDNR